MCGGRHKKATYGWTLQRLGKGEAETLRRGNNRGLMMSFKEERSEDDRQKQSNGQENTSMNCVTFY